MPLINPFTRHDAFREAMRCAMAARALPRVGRVTCDLPCPGGGARH